jgi:hypothetical protein
MPLRLLSAQSLALFFAAIAIHASSPSSAALQASVLTYHNDNLRTGANTAETSLTTANVNVNTFGKLYSFPVDSLIYGQPLYVPNVPVNGTTHNLVIVATENNTIYSFDADNKVSTPVWKTHVGIPVPCSTNQPVTNSDCDLVLRTSVVGITATPLIDLTQGTNGALFVEVRTNPNNSGKYSHSLHKIDLTTGKEMSGSPAQITGSVKGTGRDNVNGVVTFNQASQNDRGALLLAGGTVYIPFASINDAPIFHGWIFGFSSSTMQKRYLLNITPNASSNGSGSGQQGGIWNGTLAADATNNIFTATGNGTWDTTVGDWGQTYLKLKAGTKLSVADYFTPNALAFDLFDTDLDTNSPILLPDQTGTFPHLLIGGDKNGTLYLVNRDNMGKYNSSLDQILEELPDAIGVRVSGAGDCDGAAQNDCNYSSGAYWNGNVYFSGVNDSVKSFSIVNATVTGPTSESAAVFGFPGASPSISSNGNTNGILWVVEPVKSILHAYDATNLGNELYNSTQATGGRDSLGSNVKFAPPTIVNGKVFVGTKTQVVVYGLLP